MTPLTYYGGKQRIADRIVPLLPAHRCYVEPFAGGAAVLYAKPRVEREVLNDVDGAVTAFWRVLRDDPDELAWVIAQTPYSREEWEACRSRLDDETAADIERARRLLVTIDQSFARCGDTWSPPSRLGDRAGRWQAKTWANMPEKLLRGADRLRGVAVENRDAVELIDAWDIPDTVIYCDPPYTGNERSRGPQASTSGSSGGKRGYRYDDEPTLWPRLVERLASIEHAAVVLSGYPCAATETLEGAGWQRLDIQAQRASGNRAGQGGGSAPETVWLHPRIARRVPSLLDDLASA